MNSSFPPELLEILTHTPELNAAFLVGGCVRDWFLGIPQKDYDIEVFGCSYERLSAALGRWGRVDLVGRSFGVVKLSLPSGQSYDFSIPRRDSKIAAGHKGFKIEFDESITLREAAARRDYTINSLMYDPRSQRILDFFEGKRDLKNRVLRHTSSAFPEDPLRVLRGMQFAARFNLTADPSTVSLCREIKSAYEELAKERVREEWFKWADKGQTPSLGLRFLSETGWMEHYPELQSLKGVPQDQEWHPEGDVYTHTCHCCDALAGMPEWRESDAQTRVVLMLAILCHDFGKAITTSECEREGKLRIISPGHERASASLADGFLRRIDAPSAIRERVLPLVTNHMAHFDSVSDRAIRRLAKRLEPESIRNLVILMTADAWGRPPKPRNVPETVVALAAKAHELAVHHEPPAPILKGRHLLELGFNAGPEMGRLLRAAYEAQLSGEFDDLESAMEWLSYHHRP
jgi:tRNA nucleotidyltransferase (CCA-adding enzyme)